MRLETQRETRPGRFNRFAVPCAAAVIMVTAFWLVSGCKPATNSRKARPPVRTQTTTRQAKPAGSPVETQAGRLIIVEAESFQKKEPPMVVATDADKESDSGKVKFVWCPEGPDAEDISTGPDGKPRGKVVVKVHIPKTGKYWFWARVWAKSSCADTCRFVLKKGAVTIKGLNFKLLQPTHRVWQWLRKTAASESRAAVKLKAGDYELEIRNNEDGMRIDKVLFTDVPPGEFVPVGPAPEL